MNQYYTNRKINDMPSPPTSKTHDRIGAAEIALQIRRAILNGEYQYQERLSPERDLAAEFGTARGTIRQALKRLEDMNLVHRKVGSGTYVNYLAQSDHEQVAESTSPLELVEVRLAVEPDIARMAVVNANTKYLRRLRNALFALEEAGADASAFSKADEMFHLKMAECSQNPLLVWIYQLINEVRGRNQWDVRKDRILTPETIAEYNAQHRALYEAIERRDATDAVRIITEHLNKAKSQFLGS